MSKDNKSKPSSTEAENLKVHADYKELGRITVEDLNEYFDSDLMISAIEPRRKD